jgi:hypothetical protein
MASSRRGMLRAAGPRQGHFDEAAAVELGVDQRRVQRAVPQHVGHLLERGAAGQQTAGHRVAQQVRAGVRQSGAGVGLADGLAHEVRADRPFPWRHVAGEDHAVLGLGSLRAGTRRWPRPVASGSGITSSRRPLVRRKVIVPASQSMSSRLRRATSPLRRPRSSAAHHGVGAQHRRAALAKGSLELFDLCRLQRLGQRCQLPVRRIRQRTNQRMGAVAQRRTPAEVAAQGRDHGAQARRRLVVLGLGGEEAAHVLRRDDLEPDGVVTEVLAQQRFDEAQRSLARLRGEPSDLRPCTGRSGAVPGPPGVMSSGLGAMAPAARRTTSRWPSAARTLLG